MTSVAIVGGKLQGTEAVYLAKKAGFRSLLIDKNVNAPASGFCDEMGAFDVRKKEGRLIDFLRQADFILPALENDEAHAALIEISREYGFKLAFDARAYSITHSKLKTDRLIREYKVPAPRYYPESDGPYIIKPSEESGSSGVSRVETADEVKRFLNEVKDPESWVVQEYLEGPSYSVEIIGIPGMYRTYETTKIHMDEVYDCKMVTAPCAISQSKKERFSEIAKTLAAAVGLHGIMDVEVIDHEGELKVLELDARIPSQTPIAVLHCSGINLLSELADIVLLGGFTDEQPKRQRHTAVEHYLVDRTGVFWKGEHMMTESRPLMYRENFFGADEVVSDYNGSNITWRGEFINSAETEDGLKQKRFEMLRKLNEGMRE